MAEAMVVNTGNKEPSTKEKSAVPNGQKGKERKRLPPPAVASTTKGKTGNFGSTPAPTPPTAITAAVNFNSEAIAILREINSNQNKTNDKFEKLSHRVDELYNMQGDYECEAEAFPVYDTQSFGYYPDNDEQYLECEDESYVNVSESNESPKRPAEEQDNVFAPYLKKFKKIDSVDKDVALPLADIVNTAFRDGMPDDVYNELTKNINQPGNCVSLKETRVNQGVWSVLKPYTQTEDSKLRGIQNAVVKATVNVTKMMDAGASTFDQKLMDWGTDAIAILGQANKWLNVRRKDLHKKDMDPKLHYLCSSSLQSTDQLYGDSIIKDIKDAQEFNKISRQVGARGRGMRGRGRSFSSRPRGSFYMNRRRGSIYGYQSNYGTKTVTPSGPKNSKPEHRK